MVAIGALDEEYNDSRVNPKQLIVKVVVQRM